MALANITSLHVPRYITGPWPIHLSLWRLSETPGLGAGGTVLQGTGGATQHKLELSEAYAQLDVKACGLDETIFVHKPLFFVILTCVRMIAESQQQCSHSKATLFPSQTVVIRKRRNLCPTTATNIRGRNDSVDCLMTLCSVMDPQLSLLYLELSSVPC